MNAPPERPNTGRILSLIEQLNTTLAERTKLFDERHHMVTKFRDTGVRSDPRRFREIQEALTDKTLLCDSIRLALQALGNPGYPCEADFRGKTFTVAEFVAMSPSLVAEGDRRRKGGAQ